MYEYYFKNVVNDHLQSRFHIRHNWLTCINKNKTQLVPANILYKESDYSESDEKWEKYAYCLKSLYSNFFCNLSNVSTITIVF